MGTAARNSGLLTSLYRSDFGTPDQAWLCDELADHRQYHHNLDYNKPFQIGPSAVTAWLTDHAAPDAAMLLVEADGKRIFYTGDFRADGRKDKLVEWLMSDPPADIDILITEGTHIGTDKPTVTVTEIERRLVRLLDEPSGRVFVYWSAQNVDRTVSLFRAVRQRRRRMFVDLYTAEVMDLVSAGTRLPRLVPEFSELALVVTKGQRAIRRQMEKQSGQTDTLIERCKASGASHRGTCTAAEYRQYGPRQFDQGLRRGRHPPERKGRFRIFGVVRLC